MPETEAVPTPKDGEKEEPKKSDSPKEHVEEEPIDEKDQSEQKENINNGVEEEAKVKNESEENGTEAAEDTDDDSKKWDFTRGPRNRVKLYVLCEQRVWDDRGTGHVACLPLPDKSGFHAIVVRLEANEKNVLESKILLDTVYQKQQLEQCVTSDGKVSRCCPREEGRRSIDTRLIPDLPCLPYPSLKPVTIGAQQSSSSSSSSFGSSYEVETPSLHHTDHCCPNFPLTSSSSDLAALADLALEHLCEGYGSTSTSSSDSSSLSPPSSPSPPDHSPPDSAATSSGSRRRRRSPSPPRSPPSMFSSFHSLSELAFANIAPVNFHLDPMFDRCSTSNETLIVWSESDTTDLALSFQEKTGCEELWTRICEVQGKDPKECVVGGNNENDDGEEGESSDGASGSGSDRGRRGNGSGSNNAYNNRAKQISQEQMPPFEMARLQEIEYIFNQGAGSGIAKEKLATAIESLDYIPKMCDVFKMCEDIENKKGLECIFHICKHMFMLNKNSIIEILLHDDNLKDIIGILEYDPINKEPKPHREFLYEKAHFKQILPMSNDALRDKIHQAYRVQYVQDVCLPAPSLFEENNLSVLNSYIFFLRVDIVTMVQESEDLMTALFKELVDPVCLPARRRELSAFLKELCALSGALQQTGTNSKEAFYKALLNHDVLRAIEPTFRGKDGLTKQTMTEILHMVSEYNSQAVREFIIHQSKDKADDDILLNLLLKHIVTDRDPELSSATMMLQVMRLLLDPEHMAQKGEKNDFLHIFYSKCLPTLTASLLEIVDGVTKPKKDDYHTAKKLSLVLRLLNFCVSHHALPMRTFVIRRDLLNKVLVLLNSRHHFLALYALKLLRSVIQQKDEFYYNYVTEKNVFDKVVECLEDNGRRNNLLNSSVIELFEFMRQEDMKPVIYHIVERHGERLSEHNYVKTFRDLKTRYDQHKNREEELRRQREERESGSSYSRREEEEMRWKSREREMEKEEQWFDNDDDEDEEEEEKEKEEKEREEKKRQERSKAPGPSPGRKSGAEPMFPKMKSAKQDEEEAGVFGGGSTPKLSSALGLGALANAPKIVIKVIQSEGTRSRSPSPGTIPPREDEVSSSHEASSSTSSAATAAGATSPSGAAQKRPAPATSPSGDVPKKGLVEYDDSDSDPEEAEEATEETGGVTGDDAVPSSSTGSPTMDETECAAAAATTGTTAGGGGGGEGKRKRERRETEEDVSSTSGDDERDAAAAKKQARKRESTDADDMSTKRIRVDDDDKEDDVITPPVDQPVDAQ